MLTDDQIKYAVTRFLGWRLPEDFAPDAGISFKREFNEHTSHPMKHEPVGTNLLTGSQAEAMIRHLLDGMPASPVGAAQTEVERLTNALHFYGDMGNYRNTTATATAPFHVLEESPPGTVARLALAGVYDVMLERYTAKRLGAVKQSGS